MMWVLVPVKTPTRAKQRLATILTLDERRDLARAMALDLLALLTSHAGTDPVAGLGPVIVCGNDASTEDLARAAGVRYLAESALGCSGLSPVVNAAATVFAFEGAQDLLVIHGDVPLLSHDELERFLQAHRKAAPQAVTLVPDRWHGGTNLLAWRPIASFSVQYGEGSFRRHCDSATRNGADLTVCELPGASIDVDELADLRTVVQAVSAQLAPHTRRFLHDSEIGNRLSESG